MSTKRCSEGQECKPRLCRKPLAMRRIFCSLAPGRRHAFFFLFLRGGVTARIFPSLPSGGERRVRRAVGTGSWQSYRPLRSPLPLARARGEQNAAQERKRKASRQMSLLPATGRAGAKATSGSSGPAFKPTRRCVALHYASISRGARPFRGRRSRRRRRTRCARRCSRRERRAPFQQGP